MVSLPKNSALPKKASSKNKAALSFRSEVFFGSQTGILLGAAIARLFGFAVDPWLLLMGLAFIALALLWSKDNPEKLENMLTGKQEPKSDDGNPLDRKVFQESRVYAPFFMRLFMGLSAGTSVGFAAAVLLGFAAEVFFYWTAAVGAIVGGGIGLFFSVDF